MSGISDRLGRCYELSGRYVLDHPGCLLVHGSIQGYDYPRIDHAWVILPNGDRYDPVADQAMPESVHRQFFSAIEHAVYDITEAAAQMVRTGHWGPWHEEDGSVLAGLSLVSVGWKQAMPTSWRPFSQSPFWDEHDVVISSEGGASGRKQFEIFVRGRHFANRPRLNEAKALVEATYGALSWNVKRLTKTMTDHYWFGPTTEFSSPTTIWVADLG